MNNYEYKDALEQLGHLNHKDAALLLGVSERASWRYASGERPVAGTVDHFLRIMISYKISARAAIVRLRDEA